MLKLSSQCVDKLDYGLHSGGNGTYMWRLNPALVVMVAVGDHTDSDTDYTQEMLVDSQDAWVHPLTLKSETGHVTASDPCS